MEKLTQSLRVYQDKFTDIWSRWIDFIGSQRQDFTWNTCKLLEYCHSSQLFDFAHSSVWYQQLLPAKYGQWGRNLTNLHLVILLGFLCLLSPLPLIFDVILLCFFCCGFHLFYIHFKGEKCQPKQVNNITSSKFPIHLLLFHVNLYPYFISLSSPSFFVFIYLFIY